MTFDAIVVGSGFGGAVCACRLAQAGLKVAVIERGRRYDAATPFPRALDDRWLYAKERGLFDVKPIEEMFVVEAAGWGGGSLIYANVHLRCPKEVFAKGWPKGYTREALDPYYDLVAYMLGIQPITNAARLPKKTERMRGVAEKIGRTEQFVYPNLAIAFEDTTNPFGAKQEACDFCGECVIGCTNSAKSTLDLNYLREAENKGATVLTECEVTRLERKNEGYVLEWKKASGEIERAEAKAVFLCAGAINTTSLLIESALPNISSALGERYSGNGDFLGFAFGTKGENDPCGGPTITTGIVFDDQQTWFILEEGGYPKELAWLIQSMRPIAESSLAPNALRDEIDDFVRAAAGKEKALSDTSVFLSMGRDLANGRIARGPRIEWDVASNQGLYESEQRLNSDVAKALGGALGLPPTWKLLRQPISVHNLGGCVMADSKDEGVCDANGEVFGYPNLYVMDGAALPSSTGVNPSHTIAAVAERNVERAIRKLKADWRAPDWDAAQKWKKGRDLDPLAKIRVPSPPPKTKTTGVELHERLSGDRDADLTIDIRDVDRFLADPNYAALVKGTIDEKPIAHGAFNVFTIEGSNERRASYLLPVGNRLYEGTRVIGEKDGRVRMTAREGRSRKAPVDWRGALRSTIDLKNARVTSPPPIFGRERTLHKLGEAMFGAEWRPTLVRERLWKLAALAYWREIVFALVVLLSIGLSLTRRGIELGFEVGFIALVGTSLLSSMAVYILIANVLLGVGWLAARQWRPEWTLPIHLNRWVGHAEALLGWLTFAMVSTRWLPIQVSFAAVAILFGGKFLDRLAGARTTAPEDLLWARRPLIYIATLASLAALCALAPDQRRTLGPLVVAIGAGMMLRASVAFQSVRKPDHPIVRKIVHGESQHDAKVAFLVLLIAAIVPLAFLGLRPGEAKGDRAAVCETSTFVPDVSLFVVSDSQFHELDGKRSGVHLDLADRLVPVAVRPIELDLLSEVTLLHFGFDIYQQLKKTRRDMKWAHIGDFGDLGCSLELERLRGVFNAYSNIGKLAGIAPGNHDSSFVGNFDWHPDWDSVCKAPSVRLEKEASDAQLEKLLDANPDRIVRRMYERAKPLSPFPGHGYLAMVSPIGTTKNASGDHPVIGVFIDSSDHGAFDIGVAGVVGSVSDEQEDFLVDAAKRAAKGSDAYYVLFLHHPFADLDWRGKKNVGDLAGSLGNVLAVFSAHTHLSARVRHGSELRNATEYVVGSTIDPPQEATLLDIGPDASGRTTVRVETIPAVRRPTDLACPRATDALRKVDCETILSDLRDRCPRWLKNDEGRTPETADGAHLVDVFPRQVERHQRERAFAMLTCFTAGAPSDYLPDDPLDDRRIFPKVTDLWITYEDELVCASWAASIVQAYKHTPEGPHTMAETLGHLHEQKGDQLYGSKVWVDVPSLR
jgi:cholesterol oxidase